MSAWMECIKPRATLFMIANGPDKIRTSAFRTQVYNFIALRKAPVCPHLWYGLVIFTNLRMFVNTHHRPLCLSFFISLCRQTEANHSRPDRNRTDQTKLITLRYRTVWCRNSVSMYVYSSAILARAEATVENNALYAYRYML